MVRAFQLLTLALGFLLASLGVANAKIVGCFIAFEADGKCDTPSSCKAGFNKVWFEDKKGVGGTAPRWVSPPSKAEREIYYEFRNKFIEKARNKDGQSFAARFGDRDVFEPETGRTAKYNFYYNCKAQPE